MQQLLGQLARHPSHSSAYSRRRSAVLLAVDQVPDHLPRARAGRALVHVAVWVADDLDLRAKYVPVEYLGTRRVHRLLLGRDGVVEVFELGLDQEAIVNRRAHLDAPLG